MCWLWGLYEVGECAAACTSELVANAIAHAQWPPEGRQRIPLVVSISAGTLLVEVCDPDPQLPLPRVAVDWETVDLSESDDIGESGFGLGIVQARVAELGGEFGCVSGVRGKSVFFALPVPKSAALLVPDGGTEAHQ
jgi:two-component sensor histidine kinase